MLNPQICRGSRLCGTRRRACRYLERALRSKLHAPRLAQSPLRIRRLALRKPQRRLVRFGFPVRLRLATRDVADVEKRFGDDVKPQDL